MRRSKKMFSKFTSFVHNAVEALAPEMTHLEQFRYHWKSITQFFLDSSNERMSVESTSIPHHIEQMLFVLLQEEQEHGASSHGPSMEFMLQHKILETMQTLGRADCPPGMKRQVLVFFTNLLGKSKQQLLPHVNAHKPVNKLIRCCGEVKAAPTESEEVAFLLQVSSKLKQDSYLVNFFLEKPSQENGSTSPRLTLGSMEREREKPEYCLVDALLALTRSEDSRVAIKACEGLILVTSIPEDNAASVIVLYTAFCERMADQLSKLFKSLPAVIDPYEMKQLSATWGFDSSEQNMSQFPGKRQMIAFFSWLDYINQLSVEAHPMVSQALAFAIKERYILTAIEPGLSQASEPCAITVTALLTRCLSLVTSPLLAQEFAAILLGTGEEDSSEGSEKECPHKIRNLLIHRINHISDQLAVETLRLFQALLQLPYQPIMDILVTNNFKSRMFIDQEKVKLNDEILELSIKSLSTKSSGDNLVKKDDGLPDKPINSDVDKTEKLLNELEIDIDNGINILSSEKDISNLCTNDDKKEGGDNHVDNHDPITNSDHVGDKGEMEVICNENDINCVDSDGRKNSIDSIDENEIPNSHNKVEESVTDYVIHNEPNNADTAIENKTGFTDGNDSDNVKSTDEIATTEDDSLCDISEPTCTNSHAVVENGSGAEEIISPDRKANTVGISKYESALLETLNVPEQASIKEQQQQYTSNGHSESDIDVIPQNIKNDDNDTRQNIKDDENLNTVDDFIEDDPIIGSKTFSKKRIEKVVNGFLMIFPEVLRTSELIGDVGYDSYLRDAHKQCEIRNIQAFQYDWPTGKNSNNEIEEDEEFYEGDFLNCILKRLQKILDQPFDINLEVTAIIALLCQFQHPYLHEFLMDTADTVKGTSLTPHRILQKLCEDMKIRASRIPSCQALLLSMRKNLNVSTSNVLDSIPEESFFQAVIILEEFCKELAAIAFVTATQNEDSS